MCSADSRAQAAVTVLHASCEAQPGLGLEAAQQLLHSLLGAQLPDQAAIETLRQAVAVHLGSCLKPPRRSKGASRAIVTVPSAVPAMKVSVLAAGMTMAARGTSACVLLGRTHRSCRSSTAAHSVAQVDVLTLALCAGAGLCAQDHAGGEHAQRAAEEQAADGPAGCACA